MKLLHVNDVASVGSILVRASDGRDALFQPVLRRDLGGSGPRAGTLALHRLHDSWRLRRQFRQGGYTNLHVHYATFAFLADLARLPYSLHVHGGDVLLDLDHPIKRRLVLRAIRRARTVIVSTPDLLVDTQRLRRDARYVPNPMEVPAAHVRPALGSTPRAILLSKMDRLKGWDRQVEVVAEIKHAFPDLAFSFFAHGQLEPGQRERLCRELTALGGTIVPPLSREQYLELVSSFDFAIGQLEVGALGMSEMEALARGLPTIANVTAHRRIGGDPPTIDPQEAAATVAALWKAGSGAWVSRGERGRDYIRRAHHPQKCLAMLEQELERVLLLQ